MVHVELLAIYHVLEDLSLKKRGNNVSLHHQLEGRSLPSCYIVNNILDQRW